MVAVAESCWQLLCMSSLGAEKVANVLHESGAGLEVSLAWLPLLVFCVLVDLKGGREWIWV